MNDYYYGYKSSWQPIRIPSWQARKDNRANRLRNNRNKNKA